MTTELWCLVCGDPFDVDATVRADHDEPLCSAECQDRWAALQQAEFDYELGYAPRAA